MKGVQMSSWKMFCAQETGRSQRTANARSIKKKIAESGLCDKGEGDGMKENRGKCVWGMKNDGSTWIRFCDIGGGIQIML